MTDAAMEMAQMIEDGNAAFDIHCQERHVMGEEKYGPVKFMGANTLEEAMAEVIDLANYARYTFIKLYILNQQLAAIVTEKFGDIGTELLGSNSFVPNRQDT